MLRERPSLTTAAQILNKAVTEHYIYQTICIAILITSVDDKSGTHALVLHCIYPSDVYFLPIISGVKRDRVRNKKLFRERVMFESWANRGR